jgi:hypothetical protein
VLTTIRGLLECQKTILKPCFEISKSKKYENEAGFTDTPFT